ncbi:hypothetical protein FA95DRAFT_1577717, partial [Auriscalpium vulgare]
MALRPYDRTGLVIHKTGCPICRAFFLHASEAILVEDLTYLKTCKRRDSANLDLEKELQRLKDRVKRRDNEIAQLRSQLAARHEQHGDDSMVLDEDHTGHGDARTSKKRRTDENTRTPASRTDSVSGASGNTTSEPSHPGTGINADARHDPGQVTTSGQELGGGYAGQPHGYMGPTP